MCSIGDPIVRPETKQSAVGHAITISDPLRFVPFQRSGVLKGLPLQAHHPIV
ncbi:MAG: hypothetical protein Ct9H300mP2_4840 [Candidatus Neomarinimicrobiota bacterium]|nr:MAG: hypothetical protein Ct9H300mP2_4840 [Candidatus Neomarinimicrobiota bacterium]